jgi:hypothetical protein
MDVLEIALACTRHSACNKLIIPCTVTTPIVTTISADCIKFLSSTLTRQSKPESVFLNDIVVHLCKARACEPCFVPSMWKCFLSGRKKDRFLDAPSCRVGGQQPHKYPPRLPHPPSLEKDPGAISSPMPASSESNSSPAGENNLQQAPVASPPEHPSPNTPLGAAPRAEKASRDSQSTLAAWIGKKDHYEKGFPEQAFRSLARGILAG